KPIARERISGGPEGGGGSGTGVAGAVPKLEDDGGAEFAGGADVTDVAGAADVDAVELKSAGAVNDAWHCGQVVCLPARPSAMLMGSEQVGQNTRMRAPLTWSGSARTPSVSTRAGRRRSLPLRRARRGPGRRPGRAGTCRAAPQRTGRAPGRRGRRSGP